MSNKKTVLKPASKKTKEAVQFFKGNRSAVDLLEADNGRKKLKLSPAAGRVEKKLINFTIRYEFIVLTLAVAAISVIAIWLIKQ